MTPRRGKTADNANMKASARKSRSARRPYSLVITFAPEEASLIESLERLTSLPRTSLFRWLLSEEAIRRGLKDAKHP